MKQVIEPARAEDGAGTNSPKHISSLNTRGRPPGARNKLSTSFLVDVAEDWETNGKEALKTFREKQPGAYVRTIASLIPKQFNLKVNEFEHYTDEQLRQQLDILLNGLYPGRDQGSAGDEAPSADEPARGLPALPPPE